MVEAEDSLSNTMRQPPQKTAAPALRLSQLLKEIVGVFILAQS